MKNLFGVAFGAVLAGAMAGCCCFGGAGNKGVEGSWGLYLPYADMNAGHLILAKQGDGSYSAKLLWRWASPVDEKNLTVNGNTFTIARGDVNKDHDVIKGIVEGDKLAATIERQDKYGNVVSAPVKFTGKRNPPVGPAPDMSKIKYGKPIDLIAGGMDGFELMDKNAKSGWSIKDGVLSNKVARKPNGAVDGHHGNLRTKRADFFDFNLKYDVRVPAGSNSGVYLRGIYEIQTIDSYGKPVDCHNMGAFYGRITPSEAAEKKPGEWQTVDVTLYKRHVTVVLNGKKIIDNAPVEGITGGAMTPDEFVEGPLYIQGDHSDADYRNMILTPIVK